jgi:hypothetical protein
VKRDYVLHGGLLYRSDEFGHAQFKYIRKEVKNGKTRYYYEYKPSLLDRVTKPVALNKTRQFVKTTPGEYGTYTSIDKHNPTIYNRFKSDKLTNHTFTRRDYAETSFTEIIGTITQKITSAKKKKIQKALSTSMAAAEARALKRRK